MVGVHLAANLGYGEAWLIQVLTLAIILATGFFVYVVLSTKSRHAALGGFDKLKYQLNKYHAERYWAIFVGGMLIWLWFFGLAWSPPIAFSEAVANPKQVHTVKVTAGQWFWSLEDGGYGTGPTTARAIPTSEMTPRLPTQTSGFSQGSAASGAQSLHIKAGETVEFVARSLDVNHGFSILASNKSMDAPLLQMQVIPGFDNVFYYTFEKPGTYTIRCLEYCGWDHPFMTSQLTVYPS